MKDLNHVLYYEGKDAVLELIHNAKDTPVDSVSDFSDITNIDLDQIDGIKTGIPELDKRLMKLFYGTFTIVTGVNGSGKSSFLSQLICNAIDEDKNAFLYYNTFSKCIAQCRFAVRVGNHFIDSREQLEIRIKYRNPFNPEVVHHICCD